MQTHGGAAAEAAILGAERVFRAKVRVDWNNNGAYDHELSNLDRFIEDVSVDRALTGSAPEEILLIEGSASAELTLKIHGDHKGLSLMAVFSPYNKLSIFSGIQTINCELKYNILLDTPLGTFEYPQFVGNIRTITPNRADAAVEIQALDRAEKMRKSIQLPPFAMSEEHIAYGEIDSQLIRPQWVIDNALRLCDAGVGPKRPTTRLELGLANDALDGVLVWVTGNGSYLPTIGYMDNLNYNSFPNPGTMMYKQEGALHPSLPTTTPKPLVLNGLGESTHAYGQAQYKGQLVYWSADQDRVNAQAVHYMGCTLALQGNDYNLATIPKYQIFQVVTGNGRIISAWVQNGQLWLERVYDWVTSEFTTAKVNIPTTGTHVDLFMMIDMTPGNSRVYIRAGSNVLSTGWTNAGSPIAANDFVGSVDQLKGRFMIGQAINIADAYYATSNLTGKPVNDTGHVYRTPTYSAVLDQGLNRFSYIPSAKRIEAWQLVQDVAAAEFGSVFWDETGVFRFWNWQTMLAKRDNVVRTLSLDQVENLVLSNNSDSVRNIYTVSTTKKRSVGIINIYTSSDPMEFYVPARTTSRFTIWVDDTVSPLTFYMTRYRGDAARTPGTPGDALPIWPEASVEASTSGQGGHGYVVQFLHASEGDVWRENDDPNLTPRVTAYFTSNGYVTLQVQNKSSMPLRLAQGWSTTPLSPALRIGGTKILENSDLQIEFVNEESVNKYGPRTLELSGDWYQDGTWTTQLLETLAPRTAEPVPTTDAITIAGDPRLQLGDVIKVIDSEGFGDLQLQVFGIRREFGRDTGLTDTLSVEMVPPAGPPPTTTPEDPGTPPTETVTRFNLCNNPSARNNDDEWWGGSRVTGQSGMTRTTGMSYGSSTQVVGPKVSVQRGKSYRFSAQVKATAGAVNGASIQIDWYSNYGYMSTSQQTNFSLTSGQVGRFYTPTVVAPLGATKALVTINGHSNTIVVGSVLYEQTTTTGAYFDGDSVGGRWDGAAGNSSSRIVQEV